MRLSIGRPDWQAFLAMGFDPTPYAELIPVGCWEGIVEQSAWPKRPSGIHLYVVSCSDRRRYRLFVPGARRDLYEPLRALPDGNRIRVCVRAGAMGESARLSMVVDLGRDA